MKSLISIALAISSFLGGCNGQPQGSTKRPSIEVIAWCGVNPSDPYAFVKAKTLATKAGIDATMGPCLPPQIPGYTAAFPGQRYADRDTYAWLVDINAAVGMKTYVYDAKVWEDPKEALPFWSSRLQWIAGWDMGDEFREEWPILQERWKIVTDNIMSVTGIAPFTNSLSSMVDAHIALTGELTYDEYDVAASLSIAEAHRGVQTTCAVNALSHGPWEPSPASLTWTMQAHRNAGCDRLILFGGEMPIDTPGFTTPSLVTWNGKATKLAAAVLKGAL